MNWPNMSREAQVLSLRQKIGNLTQLPGSTPVMVSIVDQCWGSSDPTVITGPDGVSVSTLVDQLYQTGSRTTLRELRRRIGVAPIEAPGFGDASSVYRGVIVLAVIGVAAVVIFGLGGAGAFDSSRRRRR